MAYTPIAYSPAHPDFRMRPIAESLPQDALFFVVQRPRQSGPVVAKRSILSQLLERRLLLVIAAALIGLHAWLLPWLCLQHGGVFLLQWMLLVAMVTFPVMVFEIALGASLAGTLPEGLRKISRRVEWIGWWCHGLALVVAVLAAVASAWVGIVAFESLLALFGNDALPWHGDVEEVHAHLTEEVFGHRERHGDWLLRLGMVEPVATVLVALAVVWFAALWVTGQGINGLRRLARFLLPLLLALLLVNLLIQFTRVGATAGLERLIGPRWEVLVDGRAWLDAVCLAIATTPLCLGLLATLAGVGQRNVDSPGMAPIALSAGFLLYLILFLVIAAALGAWVVGRQMGWSHIPAEPGAPVLIGLPAAAAGAGRAPWASALLALFNLVPMLLLFFLLTCGALLAPVIAWSRQRRTHLKNAALAIGVPTAIASFAFATGAGWSMWNALVLILFRAVLPGIVIVLLIAAGRGIGVAALADHVRAYSAVKVGVVWRQMVGWTFPVLLAALVAYHLAAERPGAGFDPAGALIVAGVPAVAAWLVALWNRGRPR